MAERSLIESLVSEMLDNAIESGYGENLKLLSDEELAQDLLLYSFGRRCPEEEEIVAAVTKVRPSKKDLLNETV